MRERREIHVSQRREEGNLSMYKDVNRVIQNGGLRIKTDVDELSKIGRRFRIRHSQSKGIP